MIAPSQTPVGSREALPKIGGGGAPPGEVAHAGVLLRELGHPSHQGGIGLEADGGDPHHEISVGDWSPEVDWSLDDLRMEERIKGKVRIGGTCHQMI